MSQPCAEETTSKFVHQSHEYGDLQFTTITVTVYRCTETYSHLYLEHYTHYEQ